MLKPKLAKASSSSEASAQSQTDMLPGPDVAGRNTGLNVVADVVILDGTGWDMWMLQNLYEGGDSPYALSVYRSPYELPRDVWSSLLKHAAAHCRSKQSITVDDAQGRTSFKYYPYRGMNIFANNLDDNEDQGFIKTFAMQYGTDGWYVNSLDECKQLYLYGIRSLLEFEKWNPNTDEGFPHFEHFAKVIILESPVFNDEYIYPQLTQHELVSQEQMFMYFGARRFIKERGIEFVVHPYGGSITSFELAARRSGHPATVCGFSAIDNIVFFGIQPITITEEFTKCLGAGGFGEVWSGSAIVNDDGVTEIKKQVAIKYVKARTGRSRSPLSKIIDEVNILQTLSDSGHPTAVRFYGYVPPAAGD
jgi:hypothetical protein